MGEGESSRFGGDESESEEEIRYPIEEEGKGNKMSEYEKKRLTRIAENRARLEALGILKAAKAIILPPSLKKSNSGEEEDDDDDYRPGDAEDEEDEEDFLGNSSSKRIVNNNLLIYMIRSESDDVYLYSIMGFFFLSI